MSGLKYKLFRTALETLYFSGAHVVLRPLLGGVGAILTLHHVRPARRDRFQPNRLLEVTPKFFERVIRRLRRSSADLVSLDEMHRRLTERDFRRRFVCVTFDDGYRDTLEFAYPILKKYEVPFTVYVATSFADRIGEMWWLALEAVIAQNELIGLRIDGRDRWFECRNVTEKRAVFDHIYWWLRQLKTEDELRHIVRELATRHRVDMAAFCADLCMTWQELATLAADPLVTIGAHTVNHPILTKVDEQGGALRAREQPRRDRGGARRAAAASGLSGRRPHLRPGPREFKIAAELGFKTAVTTRPGVIFRAARRASDRAAAHLAQRRFPAPALRQGADLRRRRPACGTASGRSTSA